MDHFDARVAEQISRCTETINQSQRIIDETRIFLSLMYERRELGFASSVTARRFVPETREDLNR